MEWVKDKRNALWIILGLSLFLFFFRLGDRSFRNPDEGRYADIAAHMVKSGNWLEPKLLGIDYLRKPPLFYWFVAASFKVFGENEWSARAVPAFFGVLGVLAVYFFSRKFFGNRAAIFSSLLLIANPWYLHVSRYLVIDSVFSFFVVASLYFFYLAFSGGAKPGVCYAAFYASVALAFLSKGVLALVFPGLSIFLYVLFTRQLARFFRESRLFLGLVIFLLIAGPWFWWASFHKPDFWNVFFVREHLSRFVSRSFEHQEGWYFYPALLAGFLFPWIIFLGPLRILKNHVRGDSFKNPVFFLLLSGFTSVFFLSLSRSKLATYLLPVIPLFCVALGGAWAEWTENAPRRLKIFYVLFAGMILAVFAVLLTMEMVNSEYSTKHFAMAVKSKIKTSDSVYVYDHPGPFYDFAFYLGRPVRLVGLGGELQISRGDDDAKKIAVTKPDFLRLLERGDHLYCLMRRSDWGDIPEEAHPGLKILIEDSRKIIFESGSGASP